MNAKFEMCWSNSGLSTDRPLDLATKAIYEKGYQDAIQSLEVTTELVELACVNAYGGWSNFHQHEREKFRKEQARALQAVLSALKEQAK